jgi:hypothetical protein
MQNSLPQPSNEMAFGTAMAMAMAMAQSVDNNVQCFRHSNQLVIAEARVSDTV